MVLKLVLFLFLSIEINDFYKYFFIYEINYLNKIKIRIDNNKLAKIKVL